MTVPEGRENEQKKNKGGVVTSRGWTVCVCVCVSVSASVSVCV